MSRRAMTAHKGQIQGNTITLEEPLPALEGKQVRVLIEPLDEAEVVLLASEQARLWKEWAANGPDGPIEDGTEPEFP